MDRVDDLGAVDSLEIDRGDPKVGVTELTLDNNQWHALVRHLDSVRMTQLMRREPPPHTRLGRGARQLLASRGGLPAPARVAPRITHNNAPTGSSRRTASHGSSCDHAQRSIPTSRRRPPLPRRTRTAPREASRSVSARSSASPIRSPARHKITISARSRAPSTCRPLRASRDDLLDRGRVCRIPPTLIPRRPTVMKARDRDRRPAMTSRVIPNGLHLPLLPEQVMDPSILDRRPHLHIADSSAPRRCAYAASCVGNVDASRSICRPEELTPGARKRSGSIERGSPKCSFGPRECERCANTLCERVAVRMGANVRAQAAGAYRRPVVDPLSGARFHNKTKGAVSTRGPTRAQAGESHCPRYRTRPIQDAAARSSACSHRSPRGLCNCCGEHGAQHAWQRRGMARTRWRVCRPRGGSRHTLGYSQEARPHPLETDRRAGGTVSV